MIYGAIITLRKQYQIPGRSIWELGGQSQPVTHNIYAINIKVYEEKGPIINFYENKNE